MGMGTNIYCDIVSLFVLSGSWPFLLRLNKNNAVGYNSNNVGKKMIALCAHE